MSRKRKFWLIGGLSFLVMSVGLDLGRVGMVNFVGLRLVGATQEEIDPDSLTPADFSDISGVTQEYVDAYKLFLKAKAGDNQEFSYVSAASAFEKIAKTTENPELRLRSLYLVTFCNFLQLKIDDAYKSGMEVLDLSKNLHKGDKRVVFLGKVISAIQAGEISETGYLKEILEREAGESLGKIEEVYSFAEDIFLFRGGVKKTEEMSVIAIVAIPAKLLLPSLSQAREKVRQAHCVSNLRQIGKALRMYLQDDDGFFSRNWIWHLAPYLETTGDAHYLKVYVCPTGDQRQLSTHPGRYTYGFNIGCMSSWESDMDNFSMLHNPAKRMYMADGRLQNSGQYDDYVQHTDLTGTTWDTELHSGGINFLFCDGHVEWIKKEDIPTEYGGDFWGNIIAQD